VPLSPHAGTLALLNETVGGSAGSSKKKPMLSRIYQKWKNALPDLEGSPLFKVLGRKKEFDDTGEKNYQFDEQTKDAWANLFAYRGSGENISLKLSIDELRLSLDDIELTYGSDKGENGESPWELFLKSLQLKAGRAPDLGFSERGDNRVAGKEKPIKNNWQSPALLLVLILMALASLLPFLKSPIDPAGLKNGAPAQNTSVPVPAKPSIAVLPFTNLSGDPSEDYLSDGITEQIITALAKTPKMRVIARNSSYIFKNKPTKVQEIGRELGVRYVLEGSVQKSGDRIRITAQLIDAAKGHHLWAESYERDMKDLFSLQDDVTKQVITVLQVKLTDGEAARIYGRGTDNLEAYLKVMKGVRHVYRFNKNDNEISKRLYHEAILLDPDYAMAYTLLGWTYRHEAMLGWTSTPEQSYQKALGLAQKALSVDEQASEPYMLSAVVYANTRQPQKALEAAKRGLSLDPDQAQANWLYGYALFLMGQFRAAIPWIEKALEMDPLIQSDYLRHLAWSYFWLGKTHKSIAMLEKTARHYPEDGFVRAILALALLQGGKPAKALVEIDRALTLSPKFPTWYTATRAVALHAIGKPDEAMAIMEDLDNRSPDNPDVLRHFGRLMGLNGRHEEGDRMAEKAVRLRPGAQTHLFLGRQYVMSGQYGKAIPELEEAIHLSPDRLLGHLWLAAAFSLSGKMTQAHAEMATVKRLNPDFTLEDCVHNSFNEYPPADKKRFIDALEKAGLK
ncbi:MAG: tetratricopeptide repeat protein, partial [Deltaproteobacteria bacterium]|nr:tetratricopeptide repeat protein [Deltaproteobacteria bacterium]